MSAERNAKAARYVRDKVRLYTAVCRELARQAAAAGLPQEMVSREAAITIFIQLNREGVTGLPERFDNGVPTIRTIVGPDGTNGR